jgi:WD40 repeat protein
MAQSKVSVSNDASEPTTVLEMPEYDSVHSIAWNDTGDMLAAASTRKIYVWSLAHTQPHRVLEPEGIIGSALQWSDQEYLHFSRQTNENTAFSVWNINTNIVENIGSIDVSGATAWNLSNGLIAVGADNRNAIYEAATGNTLYLGEELWNRFEVMDVAWSPDGELLVWLYVPIRNLAGNILVERFNESDLVPVNRDTGFGSPECSSIAWSPNSQAVACGQNEGEVWLLEVAAAFGDPPQVLHGAHGTIIDVEFNSDGDAISVIDEEHYLTIWSAATSEVRWQILIPHSSVLAWTSDSSQVAVGGSDGLIHIFASEAQAITPTPLPTATIASLFEGDTCSAPCWFGLTPGESTLEDVINTFEMHHDLFIVNPEPGSAPNVIAENFQNLREGVEATFIWKTWEREEAVLANRINMSDDVVNSIEVQVNNVVTLQETLRILGQPDFALGRVDLGISLILWYPDRNLYVFAFAHRGHCYMNTFLEDFTVWSLYYYTAENVDAVQLDYAGWRLIPLDEWAIMQADTPEDVSCTIGFRQQGEVFSVPTHTLAPSTRATVTPSH